MLQVELKLLFLTKRALSPKKAYLFLDSELFGLKNKKNLLNA